MPGCTVPFCSNSTNKGFKVYHFPRDQERHLIWVKNCGRGQSWQPTNHTCICEVHFEDSQFESHRADGIRKLKPNAIPTIFKKKPLRCYARKRKTGHVEKESVPASSYVHFILDGSTSTLPTNSEVNATVSVLVNGELPADVGQFRKIQNVTSNSKPLEVFSDHTYPKSIFAHSDIESGITVESPVTLERVNELLVGDANRYTLENDETWILPRKKSVRRKRQACRPVVNKLKTRNQQGRHLITSNSRPSANELQEIDKIQDLLCYLCGKPDKPRSGTLLRTSTDTSKLQFHEKLSEIVTSEKVVLTVEKDGVLCSQCTALLNCADRLEVELNNIKSTVINHLRQKTGVNLTTINPSSTNTTATTTTATTILNHTSMVTQRAGAIHSDVRMPSVPDEHSVPVESVDISMPKEIQCHLCRFKTPHRSFMLFHLRQHVRTTCWCDFCQKSLEDKDEKGSDLNSVSNTSEAITNFDTSTGNHQLQILSPGNEIMNNNIEVVYLDSETRETEGIERHSNQDIRFDDASSQVLVIPYKSDLNIIPNYEIEFKREKLIGEYNRCQSYSVDTQSQVYRKTNKLTTATLSNVSSVRSAVENVSILNTDKQVETLSNMEVITEGGGLEPEVFLLQAKSSDMSMTSGEQLRSLHELGLFDVQEISDSENNIFIM